jgi:malonate transporter
MTIAMLIALLPIALLIIAGKWMRHSEFVAEAFWPNAERLSYFVLLPSLFFYSLATAKLDKVPVWETMTILVLSTVSVAALLVALRRVIASDDPAFTSVFQGSVRFNTYVGVSVAAGVFGGQGVALAAVVIAAVVPTVNMLCVLVFARYGAGGPLAPKDIGRQLALNPMVLACLCGLSVQLSGWGLPTTVEPVFKALGQASLPLGLLCVGAALQLGTAGSWTLPIAMSSVAKLLIMPLTTLALCRAFGLRGEAAVAVILFQSLPTASSAYVMARQLGGDAPLMAGIIASQSLVAVIALPFIVAILVSWL